MTQMSSISTKDNLKKAPKIQDGTQEIHNIGPSTEKEK